MPHDSISVQVTPDLAKFIRRKVKNGDYPSSDALIHDALERMRSAEVHLSPVEPTLTGSKKRRIQLSVERGIADLETGRYEEFNEEGLRAFGKAPVASSAAKLDRTRNRTKAYQTLCSGSAEQLDATCNGSLVSGLYM